MEWLVGGGQRAWFAVGGVVAACSALLAVGTARVHEWIVMTDELLYAKLAEHSATAGSPLPDLHGEHVGFLGILYPYLLTPLYAVDGPVGAFEAAHVLNAVLFASAAVPAFLLGRRIVGNPAAVAVSVLTVAIPWSVNAAFLMSEPAAYPVFLWAVLACQVAISDPSSRHDALAAGGLALAFFTRPQFLFLAAVLPIAAVVASGPRRALARHRPLAAVYAAAIVAVVPLTALGQAHRLLGDYGVTATKGSLLPAAAWKSAALHLDVLAVGMGVLPFLIGAGWAYSRVRSGPPRARALAALTAAALPILALETASFDLRFGGPGVIRDRYLFYLAPLLLLATVAALTDERLPRRGIAAVTVFFAATASLADFTPQPGLQVDSAEAVLNGIVHSLSPGLPAGIFVAACGAALGAICFGLARLPRRPVLLAVVLVVFAFDGSVAGYAYARLLGSKTVSGLPVTGQPRVRDWVDRATSGSPVAALAYPLSRDWGQSAVVWWDVEFWNSSILRALIVPGGTFTYTPFPSGTLTLDFATGTFPGTATAPAFVLSGANDARFGLEGAQTATNVGLVLRQVERPYRAVWATRGLTSDGWTRPGRKTTIRVYAAPGARRQKVAVTVTLDSPPEARARAGYRLAGHTGSIDPGRRAVALADACVPGGGHADLELDAGRTATIAGPPLGPTPGPAREVGPVVSGVQVTPAGAC